MCERLHHDSALRHLAEMPGGGEDGVRDAIERVQAVQHPHPYRRPLHLPWRMAVFWSLLGLGLLTTIGGAYVLAGG